MVVMQIEAELHKQIPPWEAQHGPFTIFRERLLDLLAEVSVKPRAPSRGAIRHPPAAAAANLNGHSVNRSANASTVSSQASGHSRTTVKRHPPQPQASSSKPAQSQPGSIPGAKRIRTNSASQSSNASSASRVATGNTRRGSFKPRPSDVSTSTRAPSSIFSAQAPTRRTSRTSAASSIVALLEEEDDGEC